MSDTTDWPGHPDADPDCECCLGDGLQADGETPCPCIDARRGSRAAQLTPDQYLLEGARAMQEAAARYIDKRLADYIKEHGTYDPTTGVTEFPGNGEEWTFEQEETAAAIRAINPTTVLAGYREAAHRGEAGLPLRRSLHRPTPRRQARPRHGYRHVLWSSPRQ